MNPMLPNIHVFTVSTEPLSGVESKQEEPQSLREKVALLALHIFTSASYNIGVLDEGSRVIIQGKKTFNVVTFAKYLVSSKANGDPFVSVLGMIVDIVVLPVFILYSVTGLITAALGKGLLELEKSKNEVVEKKYLLIAAYKEFETAKEKKEKKTEKEQSVQARYQAFLLDIKNTYPKIFAEKKEAASDSPEIGETIEGQENIEGQQGLLREDMTKMLGRLTKMIQVNKEIPSQKCGLIKQDITSKRLELNAKTTQIQTIKTELSSHNVQNQQQLTANKNTLEAECTSLRLEIEVLRADHARHVASTDALNKPIIEATTKIKNYLTRDGDVTEDIMKLDRAIETANKKYQEATTSFLDSFNTQQETMKKCRLTSKTPGQEEVELDSLV